tara:strand:+ start:63 stop:731 length:669 start_codon:yes stop_codon:yes gene_type:complete
MKSWLNMKRALSDHTNTVILLVAIGLLLAPLLYYGATFGVKSDDHQRWSEFGSFYGGLLGPLFSFVALVFVIQQLKLTRDSNAQNAQSNRSDRFHNLLLQYIKEFDEFDTMIQEKSNEIYAKVPTQFVPATDRSKSGPIEMEDAFQISNIYINRYRVLHEYLRRLREVDPDSPAFYWVAEKYSRQIYEFKKKGWPRANEIHADLNSWQIPTILDQRNATNSA